MKRSCSPGFQKGHLTELRKLVILNLSDSQIFKRMFFTPSLPLSYGPQIKFTAGKDIPIKRAVNTVESFIFLIHVILFQCVHQGEEALANEVLGKRAQWGWVTVSARNFILHLFGQHFYSKQHTSEALTVCLEQLGFRANHSIWTHNLLMIDTEA